MIKNYNITINNNKEIFCDEEIHINFLENEVTTLTFQVSSELDDFSSVCVLETPSKKKKTLPLNNNILVISNEISYAPGNWNLIFYGVKDETVFVSDKLNFKVDKNYLDKEESEKMDENIEILYLDLLEKMHVLDMIDLDGLESMNTDIQTIKSTVTSIVSLSSQILEIVNYNKTTLNSINNNVNSIGNLVGSVNSKIDTTKLNTETIISLLTDANVTANEILG